VLDQDPSAPTALVDFPGETGRQRWRFDHPTRWLVAHDPSQVAGLLDAAHELSKQGKWCLGWVPYEAAPGLNPDLPVKALPPGQPYAVWAVFDEAQVWPSEPPSTQLSPGARWSMGPWTADLNDAAMQTQVERIRELIRQGEVYQINLTGQVRSPFEGDSNSLMACFDALRRSQPKGYSLMLDARAACRGPGAVLSVSPELFFDWDGTTLTTRPMKGTAARHADPAADVAAATHLRQSDKERAENLMIVDLLRNDLSRIAEVGSVQVPSLFDVQALPTVWQMTSTITARSRVGLKLSEAFASLFPCGSVTGAPKRQAMHHIARLERSARGVYCGAVGIMAPGGRVTFNVPIRTVCIHTPPPPAPWSAHCGIGSGITLDATGPGEAAEWRAKQAFLKRSEAPFDLLESLRLQDGVLHRLDAHLMRLQASARHFGWAWPDEQEATLRHALSALAASHPQGTHKVRLLCGLIGAHTLDCAELTGPGNSHDETPVRVALAQHPITETGDFILHKSTRRHAYAPFAAHAKSTGHFDTLLYTPEGHLTEFTIGNVAVKLGDQWVTPPVGQHLLPGVMRASLLADGTLIERTIHLNELPHAQGMALLNSVRGWIAVDLT
jgi:para-aminobenzoate synthetase/4-amino-4-deoxychorismate lyase